MNQTRKDIVIHSVIAAAGLFCCGIGIYFTLQANIGVSPWDVFHQGISSHTGMLYGNVSVLTALQTICRWTKFDAAKVTHQSLLETLRILTGKHAYC